MEEARPIKFFVEVGTIIKIAAIVALLIAVYFLRHLLLVLLTAVVIASAVDPAANWFGRFKIPRLLSVLAVYILAFVIIGGTLVFFLPPLFSDLSEIAFEIPAQLNSLINSNPSWQTVISISGNFSTEFSVQEVINRGFLGLSLPDNVFDLSRLLLAGLFDFILIVVISFYLAVQKNGVENFLSIVIPNRHEEYILDLWRRTEIKIGRWMQGQILLSLIIGPLVFLGLTLFEVKYALTLSIIASIFEIIPIFGPVLSSVPAVIMGLNDSLTLALIMIGFYLIIHQFENHLLYPLVVKKIIGVNPLVVIISLIIGYELAGFLGVVLSVPLATLLMEFVSDIEKRKRQNA
ncbi:MAG: hypothetical protein COV08_00685 [Candidatus Vogelbacteria bacterium CG10_big_fil_rev_8_21_14_0_10_49_38]|uniref:AI-2E family transporter n=1 Tax=Candidatus Vogelbacteria bacterium CG10_big_fil_rev_8_21_14_0_10_49_38 TaxID=1975043 RepID=A0A2H0RIA1_9BACT|nr:MAG: hypothetical protein BK006_00695 [bacterium CG10_49_38]PIR46269.1 MAG: hypothetical protein COV08_00685 [Candidatus Vogelbacteria bacterium CG10_big_fil_rev_8_21_14_0_10_49_38]